MGSCLSLPDDRQSSPRSPMTPGGVRRSRKGLKKRQGLLGSSSFNSRRDELLSIPGRMFLNGASRVASLFTQQGRKGTNQDAMIVWENFGSREDTIFCGVFDGHGPYGHLVARKVRDSLPSKLSSQWDAKTGFGDLRSAAGSMDSKDTSSLCYDEEFRSSIDSEEKETHPEIFTRMRESFLRAFRVMDKELKLHPKIDCFCSGTTAVTMVKQGQDLIIGNIGDSRAVLGTRDENDSLIAIQLTVDLKPNLPREAERIRRCKGRVFALQDEPEVARVWLPNNNSPGLAMARAFGDFCLKDFGLISVPKVSYRRITERDEFIVLATDGVWDALSNSEVVDIVASSPTRSSAARSLVESAVRGWRYKYPTSKVDDCAVVCLFLNPDSSDSQTSHSDTKEPIDSSGPLDNDDNDYQDASLPIGLDRSGTVRATSEILQESPVGSPRRISRTRSNKSSTAEPQDWSALEGVSRVNTLLTLPRFVQGGGNNKHAMDSKHTSE